MVGQGTVTKPSRSDEVLDAHQHLQIANEIRERFDFLAPKRPAKPSRSESDATQQKIPHLDLFSNQIPELDKLRSLQSQSPVQFSADGSNDAQDEFVETQYCKELNSIDKQHHTTGSGFITVVTEEEGSGGHQLSSGYGGAAAAAAVGTVVTGYRSNPATNDWTPEMGDDQVSSSSKPNRSESS